MDKVTLQILANHCRAAAESMAYTLYRTAHSTFVKETEDFTIGIATRDGLTAAAPKDLGATWLIGLDYGGAIRMIPDYAEGDIGMTNDPYSGFVCTHAPDLHLWKPVFHEGELVCFTVGHIHNTDVGGAVPASLSRSLVEVHQEGIRIPPTKLYRRGVLNEEALSIMLANVRSPEQNWGDLKALVGAMNTGERRVHEMIAKFGIEVFRKGPDALLDHAEEQARAILREIPDGTYRFADYIDEDAEGGNPTRICLALTISGDSAVLDFTGTDPQLTSSHNVPTGGHVRHTLLLVACYYVLYTLNPNVLLNAGLTRPFTCILPEGSLLNPVFPAAVGMRSLSCNRLRSTIFGAFSLALPGKMPAAPSGTTSVLNVMTTNNLTGERVMAAVNPIMGGGGGLPFADGPDGSGGDTTYLKNSPIEITEAEVPIQVIRYELEPDSGGAGRHRGGLAQTMEFRVFSPNTRVTARNRDRSRFRAWGTLGGKAGAPSRFILNPGTPREESLGNRDVVAMGPGDVLRVTSSGGGGRGNPFERPVSAVQADVLRGFVSREAAARDYGVVYAGDEPDLPASEAERARGRDGAAQGHFHFGPERDGFETHWTAETYDALTAVLAGIPVHWRFFTKGEIFAALRDQASPGGADGVNAAFRALLQRHPQLRKAHEARRSGAKAAGTN